MKVTDEIIQFIELYGSVAKDEVVLQLNTLDSRVLESYLSYQFDKLAKAGRIRVVGYAEPEHIELWGVAE